MPNSDRPKPRHKVEALLRSRIARLALATGLIAFGTSAFLPYLMYRVAPAAFVNAELVRITAPIGGQLNHGLPKKGDLADPSIKTKLIQSLTTDRSRLVALEQEYEDAKAKAALAQAQILELVAADKALATRTEEYKSALEARFDAALSEIEQELHACRREEDVRRDAMLMAEEMVARQLLSRTRLNVIKGDYHKAEAACRAVSQREKTLKTEREASLKGTFILDGTAAPFSEQERSRLLLSRQQLTRDLLGARSRIGQLKVEIASVRHHLESLERYDMTLPEGYIVWSVLASPGSAVVEGQTIMELADCRNPFVVVQFPERELASIRVGGHASIRLIGERQWQQGRIKNVRGSAARSDELLAAAVPDPDDRYILVEIALPENAQPIEAERSCNIGRLAEVRLERIRWNWVHGLTDLWTGAAQRVATLLP